MATCCMAHEEVALEPCDVLEHGEIFCQSSKRFIDHDGKERTVILGPALVRLPTYALGDIELIKDSHSPYIGHKTPL